MKYTIDIHVDVHPLQLFCRTEYNTEYERIADHGWDKYQFCNNIDFVTGLNPSAESEVVKNSESAELFRLIQELPLHHFTLTLIVGLTSGAYSSFPV